MNRNSLLPIVLGAFLLLAGGASAWFFLLREPANDQAEQRGLESKHNGVESHPAENGADSRRAVISDRKGVGVAGSDGGDGRNRGSDSRAETNSDTSTADPSSIGSTAKNQPKPATGRDGESNDPAGAAAATPGAVEDEYAELDAVPLIPPTAAVYGMIKSPEGAPAAGVEMYLMLSRGNGYSQVAMARTEADGLYAFGARDVLGDATVPSGRGLTAMPIQPGKYMLEARISGAGLTQASIELKKGAARKDLTLAPIAVVELTFECRNSNSQMVSQPHVTVVQRDSGHGGGGSSRFNSTTVSSSGTDGLRTGESMTVLPAIPLAGRMGQYKITVHALARVELTVAQAAYRCVDPPGGRVVLNLSDGRAPTLPVFQFEPLPAGRLSEPPPPSGNAARPSIPTGNGIIRGKVSLLFANALIQNTSVELSLEGARSKQVQVNSLGEFEFLDIAGGEYTLYLINPNFSSRPRRLVSLGNHQTETIDWSVNVDNLSIALTNAGASPEGGIFLLKSDYKPQLKYTMIAGLEPLGVGPVTPGEYGAELSSGSAVIAEADADGYAYFTLEGTGGRITKTLSVTKPGTLTYQIIDGRGFGWSGAEIRLVRVAHYEAFIVPLRQASQAIDWSRTRAAGTDSLGRGTVERLAPGAYKLLIWASSRDPNRWDRELDVSVTSGMSVDLGTLGAR